MTLNCVKLGRAVTCMKYLASVVPLIFQAETLNWNHVPGIKFAEPCRAGGEWAYEEYLQKNLQIFLFLFDLSLLNVMISRAYNYRTK